jgi:S-DNA-T family DNA segregation ATPase FtsK/SpoIIIE
VLVGAAVVAVVGATGATVVLTHTHHGTLRPAVARHAAPAAGGVVSRSTRTAAGLAASRAGGGRTNGLGATGGRVAAASGIARARAAGGAAKALGLALSSASAAGRAHGQGSLVRGGAATGRRGSSPATGRHAGGPPASSPAAGHRVVKGGTHASASGTAHRAAGGGADTVTGSSSAGTAPPASHASRSGQTPAVAHRSSSHAAGLAPTASAG